MSKKNVFRMDDIQPYAKKAYYLFGREIADHLRLYNGKSNDQNFNLVADYELAKPFDKTLCLERSKKI